MPPPPAPRNVAIMSNAVIPAAIVKRRGAINLAPSATSADNVKVNGSVLALSSSITTVAINEVKPAASIVSSPLPLRTPSETSSANARYV